MIFLYKVLLYIIYYEEKETYEPGFRLEIRFLQDYRNLQFRVLF